MTTTMRHFTILLMALVLSSCGFALRGSDNAPISIAIDTVFVDSSQPSSELTQTLTTSLNEAQLRIVDSIDNANYKLQLKDEEFNSRTSTVNGRARAAQYTLQLGTQISLSQQGVELLSDEPFSVERRYFEDTANIAGSTQEIEILQQEMRRELVEQIMRRLRAAAQGA